MAAPDKLADWTLDAVQQLVRDGQSESDTFDFKEQIGGDDSSRRRLRAAVCSFANSRGGFLVIGVRDGDGGIERVVGLPRSTEHLTRLSDVLVEVEPSISFAPLDPPIALGADRVILVVHIPKGRRGPHTSRSDHRYYRRAYGRAAEMTREELRMAFTDHDERVGRVRLVYLSLIDNWVRLEDSVKPEGGDGPIPMVGLDLTQVRAHLGDIQVQCPELIGPILMLIREFDTIGARLIMLIGATHHDHGVQQKLASRAKPEVHIQMERLGPHLNHVLKTMQEVFGFGPVQARRTEPKAIPPVPTFWVH